MPITEYDENLYLIDLDLPREGFRKFISSWLYRRAELTLLVDPGPASTIPILTAALKKKGIDRLDYILLTHIHADHAGGTGILVKHFPTTRIICHPQGIRHLIDPAKLWAGTQKTLGDIAQAYGRMEAVEAERLSYQEKIQHGDILIEALETPGHAPHHLCYRLGSVLFAGEMAGVIYPFGDGSFYQRPATPPIFDYEIFRRSLIRTSVWGASLICLGHYGCRRDSSHTFSTALGQLEIWLQIIQDHINSNQKEEEERIFADLLKKDEGFSRFHDLPWDIQARERYFSCNSIRGIKDYLLKKPREATPNRQQDSG